MATQLKKLAGPANAATATSSIFTGTSGHYYAIKNLRYVNNTAAAITVKFGIGGTADANLLIPSTSVPAGGMLNHDCYVVLEQTEVLHINVSATGGTYTVSGVDTS